MSSDARRLAGLAGSAERAGMRGTTREFAEFYEQNFDFVWRTVRYLGLHDSSLDDAVQDTFVVAHRRFDDFDARSSRRTWLFAIAMRVVSAYRRSQRRRQRLLDEARRVTPAVSSTPFERVAHADMAQMLARALDRLPEAQRAVFVLADLEHVSAPEIARALDVKLNTVYSRLRGARAAVARELGVDIGSGEST